ncbi:competence type IV pilus major pilin ComGC [Acetobacterium bakii]|uniref:Uncharacterized protein n=1 Tax=Acetobacterium bakii TaxID=52689 RepID=A0A0L6TYW4_9FIRM|nr:prepilin-type N-terminal cleavage/methylation domain-containing protein [Acetobacterium bakii]KNZ41433.1 hypothetical protein AKG39_12525 [Acetobacterium bakii]
MNEIEGRRKNIFGFTLMEVIVVIAILGALTALAVPTFTGVLANSQTKTDQANLRIVENAVELYRAELDEIPEDVDSFGELVTELYNEGYLKTASIESVSGGTFSYEKGEVVFTEKVKE